MTHDVGQDRARGADQRAGDDQRRVAEREADAGRRPPRIGVEHRDHHRHVGAADRHDDQHAERQRDGDDQPEVERGLGEIEVVDEEHQAQGERDVDDVAPRQHDRLAAHAGAELEEGDHRAGEGDGADGGAERHFDQALLMDMAFRADVEGRRRVIGARRHQDRRHADQRMEGRHQFRHRGHRHPPRDHRADAAAEHDAAQHQAPGQPAFRRMRAERGQHGDGHADHAEIVAAPAGVRARQPAQRLDEQNAGDQIEQRDKIRAHNITSVSADRDCRLFRGEDGASHLLLGNDGDMV